MKRVLLSLSVALALAGCGKGHDADDAAAEQPSRVKHDDAGEAVVMLDADTQKTMGLETAALAPAQLTPETKVYGHVVDPMTLSATVADYVSARAAADASQAELDRTKTLAGQNNASARTLEAAEAAAKRDAAQADAARAHLLAATGKAIADRDDLPAFLQSLTSGERALVQVDLPAGEVLKSDPATARLEGLSGTETAQADFVGAIASINAQTQGRSLLFLLATNSPGFVPGAAVTAYLPTAGEAQSGTIVPRGAVVRHGGAAFVYLETATTNFTRRAISLGPPLESGWFVTEGAKPGDHVVSTGAQSVLSEELNSAGFLSGDRD